MKYFKNVVNGYILGVSTGYGSIEISESEHSGIMAVIKNVPHAEGKGYRLKEDLTWEEYDLPVPSEDDEITDEEAFAIITGEAE